MRSTQELVGLADRMRKELHTKNRRRKLKWHKECFRGSDAVSWLVDTGYADTREAGVSIGRQLLGLGLLHHVSHSHGFSDKSSRLYRFLSLEGDSSTELEGYASEISSTASDVKRNNVLHTNSPGSEKWSLGSELTRLQARVLDLAIDMEDQKEMSGILLDSLSVQIKGMQDITKLLTDKLAKANQRLTQVRCIATVLGAVEILIVVWLARSSYTALATLVCLLSTFLVVWKSQRGTVLHALMEASQAEEHRVEEHGLGNSKGCFDRERLILEAVESSKQEMEAGASRLPSPRGISRPTADLTSSPLRAADGPVHSEGPRGCSIAAGRQSNAHRREAPPTAEEISEWPDAPLLLRRKGMPHQPCESPLGDRIPVNTGIPVDFESENFKGCVVVWVQGLRSAPSNLFSGARRKTSITVQGRFKRPVSMEDLITGQEFARPAVNLPARWLVESVLIKIARSISPSMDIGPMSKPHVLVPVMAAAQEVNVSRPGEEPDPAQPIPEDMRLFDDSLVDKNGDAMPAMKRRRLFWDPKQRSSRQFSCDHVWSFTMYQSQVDMSGYVLDVALKFDLSRHLDGQPLQFMVKDRKSGQYLFNFEAWHENLLAAAQRAWESERGKGV